MSNSIIKDKSLHPGFKRLIDSLPSDSLDFNGTEFGQPAALAYLGQKANVTELLKEAKELRNAPPDKICETAMVMAEVLEAASPDCDRYFLTDEQTRSRVFFGSKWRSGWVFLMGSSDHSELAQKFIERDFLVFAQKGADIENVIDLGPRETAAVYFLQLMVNYAMVWGTITPGDSHEMSHFLEKDMPGVVVADGKLTPVEELLLLALMKMGAPAVVPGNYPWNLGSYVRVDGSDNIIEAATKFPNLRIKEVQDKIIKLPDFCNPANVFEKFETVTTIGDGHSFFVLMPGNIKDGIALPKNNDLSDCDDIGIIIEIEDERLDVSTSDYIEKTALKGISSIAGLRAEITGDGALVINCADGVNPDASMIAEALHKWILYEFPYIGKIHVKIITGDDTKKAKATEEVFRTKRNAIIENESDDTVQYFHYCLECQPFAKDHVCIVTPDRPPMCGRGRLQVKSAALFGVSRHPWKRRGLEGQDIRGSIKVGAGKNLEYGEYTSVNEAVEKLSPSHIKRVQLHGLREFPHTSCGCFQYLVFWLQSLNGFGIIERNYQGKAPEGLTWNILANAAGGKQTPGVVGVSRNYLLSKRFMQGEGGLDSLRWISPKAFEIIKDRIPNGDSIQVGDAKAT